MKLKCRKKTTALIGGIASCVCRVSVRIGSAVLIADALNGGWILGHKIEHLDDMTAIEEWPTLRDKGTHSSRCPPTHRCPP